MGKTSDTAPGAAKKTKKITQKQTANLSKSLKNCPPREFLELQTPEIQYLYSIYKECLSKQLSIAEIRSTMVQKIIEKYEFSQQIALVIFKEVMHFFCSPQFTDTYITTITDADTLAKIATHINKKISTPTISLTLKDYERFTEKISSDETMTNQLKRLLLSFIVFYRDNYHSTGWVRYDRNNIFYLAGLSKVSAKQQEKMVNYLHLNYNLDMRVVGSTQPIPCYKIDWLYDQENVGKMSNPFLSFGAMSPKNLSSVIDKINDKDNSITQEDIN